MIIITHVESCKQAVYLRAFKAQADRSSVYNSTELKFRKIISRNQL